MTIRSLSEWLRVRGPSAGLLRVEEQVDPLDFEATAILHQMEGTPGGPPPVLFPRAQAIDGSLSPFGLAFNAYGSLAGTAASLGVDASSWPELLAAYTRVVAHPRPVERVERADVHAHVQSGDDVDLGRLPWVRHVAMDGGPYFTPIVVAREPGAERYNLSWNRAMHLDRRHLSVHISPRHLWAHHREAEERGEDLPVAIVLGHHPAFNLAAAALTTITDDEYEVAGALMGAGVRVVPSISYGDALLVPADAEIVIEGRLLAGTRAVEGPFGEYLRYVGPQKLSHVVAVDAITWRDGATVLEVFTGYLDHLNAHISIEASLLEAAHRAAPQTTAVSWFRGGGPTTLVIAMRKTLEGQPMRAALAAMAASNIVKQVIVVDDDIDIEDSHEVLWAVSTRVRAADDITILKNLQGNLLDPSQSGYGSTSGFVIDATKPLDKPFPPPARVPDEAIAKYPLDRYTFRSL